ncbi:MAG: hypothetical protein VX519_05775 [Myxococcota bacterium]|nr:hypothetical protein [Myxococcota bacterium]
MPFRIEFIGAWILLTLSACSGGGGGGKDGGSQDSGDVGDTGAVDLWRAKGNGFVYLLDGEADHSRLVLEVEGTLTPRDGEDYYGWLLGGRNGHVPLGPFEVSAGEVSFEQEQGFNLFENGYNSFESYVSEGAPVSPGAGIPLWGGAMPQEALDAVHSLLVESTHTTTGEGSLRSVETTLETIRAYAQSGIDNFTDLATCADTSEAIYNAIGASAEDIDHNGVVSTIDTIEIGIASSEPEAETHVKAILDDLTTAFNALGAAAEIEPEQWSAIENAHDCIERVQVHSDSARLQASIASCAAQSCCDMIFGNVISDLGLALDGQDANEDGVVDLESEGTVECGIEFVSRLLGFPVAVGFEPGQ